MISLDRLVCRAYGAQALKRRSVKIHRSQPACRQHQRPRCSLRIIGMLWTGRSCRRRQCWLWRKRKRATGPASAPKLRQNRFKCSSVYELKAVNRLPVHELSTVRHLFWFILCTLIRLAVDQRFRSDLASDPIRLIGKFFVLVTMSPLIIVVALCLVLTPVAVFIFVLRWLMTGSV